MLSHPIVAFDIETIPDPDVGRRLWGLEGDDSAVVAAMVERRLVETEGKTGYPQLPHHRIVTIAAAGVHPRSGRFRLAALGREAMDERSHIDGFFAILRSAPSPPRLVSWNGSGFDLPVIRYRSMLLGIASPELYRSSGDWKWNNYQNRYHDMHVDLMDVLSGYGASQRVGLETMSQLLGLPGKSFLEGEVWEHVVRGENELVREYCKLDVVSTLLLYLAWEFHRGGLARVDLERYVGAAREALAREPAAGWSEIAAGLAGWPAW